MSAAGNTIHTAVIRDVDGLDEVAWDALPHPSLYLSRGWLKARSRTVKAQERFLLLTDDAGAPLASAPCYLSDVGAHPGYFPPRVITVDCLSPDQLPAVDADRQEVAVFRERLRQEAARWAPSLVVAAPGRYGGASIRDAAAGAPARALRDQLIDAVERLAAEDEAASISWLYLFEGEDPLLEATLRARGYAAMILDAECYLPLDRGSFEGYLAGFRAEYRRKIRYEMAAFDHAGVEVSVHGGEALGPELALLERSWRLKYGRSPPLEEILADYAQLVTHMEERLRVFVARRHGRALAFSVFLADGKTWYSRFGGFDYKAGNLFLYFNLLFYRPLQVMYDLGVETVRYSLKSYEAKRSRGCLLRNVLAFVRPPVGWPRVEPALAVLDRAQAARFTEIAHRAITKDGAA